MREIVIFRSVSKTIILKLELLEYYLNDEGQASSVTFYHILEYNFFSAKLNQPFCRKKVCSLMLTAEIEMVKVILT